MTSLYFKDDRGLTVHMALGGPTLFIQVGGRQRPFELHPYFGPSLLHAATLEPLANIPKEFWDAIDRWQLGGKKLNGDVAIATAWCPTCKGSGDEIRHVGGRHWEIVGKCKACNGNRVEAAQC